MSASAYPEYPDELKVSSWEKNKKSGFDAKSDVAERLKVLQKKHDLVDWELFAEGWAMAAKTAAELEAEGSKCDKLYRSGVLPLKKEALALAGHAKTAEKKADKILLVTLKSIGKAAEAYAGGIDKCAEALKETYEKAQDALPEEDDEDCAPSALVNPKLLLKQLTTCRMDPERTMKFAFVDANDKQSAMLAMHPRMSARALFGKLQAVAGVKTGAYGIAWVDGMSLMLQLDKPLSGLVKKVRASVKACGFRITKTVLLKEDGTVFELDDLPEEAVAEGLAPAAPGAQGAPTEPSKAGPTAPPQPSVTYEAKLAALLPRVKKAADEGSADATRHQRLLEFAASKGGSNDFLGAVAALRQIEQLLDNPMPRSEGGGNVGAAGVAFKARLTALIPKIKQAQTAGHPGAQEAKLKASEAGVLAGKHDFQQAGVLLDEVEQALDERGGSATVGMEAEIAFRERWDRASEQWRDAVETVDGQIAKLQAVLKAIGDDELSEIAEFGLPSVTGNYKARLMAAMMDIDRARGDALKAAAAKSVRLVRGFDAYLASSEAVAAADENPFGVKVGIRTVIGPALQQMQQALAVVA